MATFEETKKKIIREWQEAFPQLTLYSQNKFYKLVGAVLIGIELIKLPKGKEYRPHFVMYSLCGNKAGNDLKSCLSGPIVLKEYYNNKGLQYSIEWERHSFYFNEVLDSINKQTPLSFDGNISFKEISKVIDDYSKQPPMSASPNSYLQASLQEAKLKIALYASADVPKTILDQIAKRDWDTNHFRACGANVNVWLESLRDTIANRHAFLKQVSINIMDSKVSRLKKSELIE